jgi:hypothetical protein
MCAGTKAKSSNQAKKQQQQSGELLSTDEVLQRIQQQMAEVMASTREAVNTAVLCETDARAAGSGGKLGDVKATGGSSSSPAVNDVSPDASFEFSMEQHPLDDSYPLINVTVRPEIASLASRLS